MLVLAVVIINVNNIIAAFHHSYYVYEQDAYMHMVIAMDLLQNHDWFQHINYRINAPIGADTHAWTVVISALLVGGAWVLHYLIPLSTALYVWAFILPMLSNVIAVCAMLWVINVCKPSNYQRFFIVSAFILNPFISSYFIPLRVDYDFLLILLSIVYWGCLLRLISSNKRKWVYLTAFVASLGVWTSISFIILIFIGLGFLIWLSFVKNQPNIAKINTFIVVLCLFLAIAIRIEHRQFFTVAHDILSIVHLSFFLLLLLSLKIYERYLQTPWKKIIYITICMIVSFFIMNYVFPGFYRGPYNHVDSYLLQHFFPVLSEFHSPFSIDNALALALLSYFIVGVSFFIVYPKPNVHLSLLLWASIATILFALWMYRWNEFFAPLSILLVSFFVAHCCDKKTTFFSKLIIVIAMAGLPAGILLLTTNYTSLASQQCQQQFYNMLHNGFLNKPQFRRDNVIFVHSNYGPLMLYSTHFSVIATNDHHNPQGIKDSNEFFSANETQVKRLIMNRNIDLILLCKAKQPRGFDITRSKWLEKIPLPESYSQWQLYRHPVPLPVEYGRCYNNEGHSCLK